MEVARDWKEYQILDMADGEKLEIWNNIENTNSYKFDEVDKKIKKSKKVKA